MFFSNKQNNKNKLSEKNCELKSSVVGLVDGAVVVTGPRNRPFVPKVLKVKLSQQGAKGSRIYPSQNMPL